MESLKTNHNVRIVTLTTAERVLCIFGEFLSDDNKIIGYRLYYPYTLTLGESKEDGSAPVKYSRWCPFSPVQEHRIKENHIISVVYPENAILNSYVKELNQMGITEDQIFYPVEELENGDNSESTETGE